MQHLTIKGLVIRETDFGESDRYLTVLTEVGTRIEVLCRGVRRRNGRLASAVRLFCWSEMTLYESRGRFTLNDAALLDSFWGVTARVEHYALVCYFAELAGVLTDEEEQTPAVTRLFLGGLYALTRQNRAFELVKAAFELRLLSETGYAPALDVCGACCKPIEGQAYFSVREGAIIDGSCRKRLGDGDFVALGGGTLAALRHIVSAELPRVYGFSLGGPSRGQLAVLCERYALYHTGRGYDSLDFYHSLLQTTE